MKSPHLKEFRQTIWDHYRDHGRDFAWRQTTDPYCIMVSEVMLQQTQTHRVAGKYEKFVEQFPSFAVLATASLRDILSWWQGLGYNRRALALQRSAQRVMEEFEGKLPDDPAVLVTFPGIGPATAASISAFAFNKPTIFIETNIRAVFIHFFFQGRADIKDQELYPLVQATVDASRSREWYYALMDYGVMLKKQLVNPSRRSAHHVKQSVFEGSERQIRGLVLKALTQHGPLTMVHLQQIIDREPVRVERQTKVLMGEGFIKFERDKIELS